MKKLMRKLKILVAVGALSVLVIVGFTIWFAAAGVSHAVSAANQLIFSPTTQNQIQDLKTEFKKMQFQPEICWQATQRLVAFQPWIENTVLDNLTNLKVNCLRTTPMKNLINEDNRADHRRRSSSRQENLC